MTGKGQPGLLYYVFLLDVLLGVLTCNFIYVWICSAKFKECCYLFACWIQWVLDVYFFSNFNIYFDKLCGKSNSFFLLVLSKKNVNQKVISFCRYWCSTIKHTRTPKWFFYSGIRFIVLDEILLQFISHVALQVPTDSIHSGWNISQFHSWNSL